MRSVNTSAWLVAGALMTSIPVFPQSQNPGGEGHAIVTILPAHDGERAPVLSAQDLKVKVSGRPSSIVNWTPLHGPNSRLELVLLIDSSARSSLGEQLGDITGFVKEMPANAKVGIAYMMNGSARLAGPLSSDAQEVLRGLQLPMGTAGSDASPYFCLSDLAKHWPSTDGSARREVVMVTDGVDRYNLRYDPDDPYVQSAITDSVRAGLVVYAMYWMGRGQIDRSDYESNAGQNLLLEVTQATGGNSYWEGSGNPVSFSPYFADLRRRLQNQYSLTVAARLDGKPDVENLKVQLDSRSAKVVAPNKVYIDRADIAAR